MASTKKDITEETDKIKAVKSIVKKRASEIQLRHLEQAPISQGPCWRDLSFSNPDSTIRLGTLFSGIGAIEHAFQRLKINHQIVFAGDIDEKCKKAILQITKLKKKIGFLT